jgi:hypothetical protein
VLPKYRDCNVKIAAFIDTVDIATLTATYNLQKLQFFLFVAG